LKHRLLITLSLLSLTVSLAAPAAALFSSGNDEKAAVSTFSKNGTVHDIFSFSSNDFITTGNASLSSLVIQTLPASNVGLLKLGNIALQPGDSVSMHAISGLRFFPLSNSVVSETQFSFLPLFSDGSVGDITTVSLHLLTEENSAPIAENVELSTYRNVAVSGQFAAVDPEGDIVTFRLMSKPARGEVQLSEDGSGTFVYSPYENKKGKDSFTYVAVDSVGNISSEATVKITISKAKTAVTYADMQGHSSHVAAIRLAEEGILIGTQVDGSYFFHPDTPVSRDEFVAMAMGAAGLKSLEGVTVTGFSDDHNIPVWAKGYISSALRSGLIKGMPDDQGSVCFNTGATVTKAEAAVVLDRLLDSADVAGADALGESIPTWASQSALNMNALDVLSDYNSMDSGINRAQAAEMLCAMLDIMENRERGWL